MSDDNKQAARDYATFAGSSIMRALSRILDANRRANAPIGSAAGELEAAMNDLAEAQKNISRAIAHYEIAEDAEKTE